MIADDTLTLRSERIHSNRWQATGETDMSYMDVKPGGQRRYNYGHDASGYELRPNPQMNTNGSPRTYDRYMNSSRANAWAYVDDATDYDQEAIQTWQPEYYRQDYVDDGYADGYSSNVPVSPYASKPLLKPTESPVPRFRHSYPSALPSESNDKISVKTARRKISNKAIPFARNPDAGYAQLASMGINMDASFSPSAGSTDRAMLDSPQQRYKRQRPPQRQAEHGLEEHLDETPQPRKGRTRLVNKPLRDIEDSLSGTPKHGTTEEIWYDSISLLDLLAFRECSFAVPGAIRTLRASLIYDRGSMTPKPAWAAKQARLSAKDARKHARETRRPVDVVTPLHKSTNAYRVALGEGLPDEELNRTVKSILNKMCPERFDVLAEKLVTLPIESPQQLATVIDHVFTKAVTEHVYCEMYSDLCMVLRPSYPSFPSDDGSPAFTFTRVLLNRCQEEFENLPSNFEVEAGGTDDDMERVLKAKDKVLGNMKFIGQLFLRRLLSNKVVREVVFQLIFRDEKPFEHYIECLCILLRNIGSSLESSSGGKEFAIYFMARVKHLLTLDYSKRIKFAMQGIVELQENAWEDRVLHARAKTKEEVRLDQISEEQRRSLGVVNPFAVTEIAGQRPAYMMN